MSKSRLEFAKWTPLDAVKNPLDAFPGHPAAQRLLLLQESGRLI